MGQHPPTGWKGYFIGRIMQTDEWQYQFLAETGSQALQDNNSITKITPIKEGEKVIGYTISFTKGRANYHLSWRKR